MKQELAEEIIIQTKKKKKRNIKRFKTIYILKIEHYTISMLLNDLTI